MIRIVESPREAMQALELMIPAEKKAAYINSLFHVGFDTIETGSFVSTRLIPQMADSLKVLDLLDVVSPTTNIMFLVVSKRGAETVSIHPMLTHISYPHAISPVFLKKNLNTTTSDSLDTVSFLADCCAKHGKIPVIYISMAFGNSFGDPWNLELLEETVEKLVERGIRTIPLSNVSKEISPQLISMVYSHLIPRFPDVEFGLHLHTSNKGFREKVMAAYLAGVRRFDTVMTGLGGCPMAEDDLLGNLSTENLYLFLEEMQIPNRLDSTKIAEASHLASTFLRSEE